MTQSGLKPFFLTARIYLAKTKKEELKRDSTNVDLAQHPLKNAT